MKKIIECNPGEILKEYSASETLEIEKEWMRVFCKNKQGLNTRSYKWHIFSGEGYPAIDGEEALAEYKKQQACEFLIIGDDGENAFLTNKLPETCSHFDYYIFPPNMAWTMVFTHEEGWCGPYFAKHPEYQLLNEENIKAVEKEHQKEIAKQKGWH